jgi:hypothetical protein
MSYRAPVARSISLPSNNARRVTARIPWGAAGLLGLGQKAGSDTTAQDWSTALTTGGSIVGSIIAGTQGQTAATTPAAPVPAYVEPTSSTDWYWPVVGGLGVVFLGGLVYMMTKKPTPKATANGWRRRSSKGLRGKRRSRSKRTSMRANGWRRRSSKSLKGKRRSRSKRGSARANGAPSFNVGDHVRVQMSRGAPIMGGVITKYLGIHGNEYTFMVRWDGNTGVEKRVTQGQIVSLIRNRRRRSR